MDYVLELYNEGKLLVRAMEQPSLMGGKNSMHYECQDWINEFEDLIHDELDSLSTTLIMPGVGVRNNKNIGFLVNSDLADCFHIAKEDSCSYGNLKNGDFNANKSDFSKLNELAEYIKNNKAIEMNEVNINIELNAVVGLYINTCEHSSRLLKKIYVVKCLLKKMTGIDYPIYLYDWMKGKLERINLSQEEEEELINSLESNQILYWPDNLSEPMFIPVSPMEYGNKKL